jgi:hypothetical protein
MASQSLWLHPSHIFAAKKDESLLSDTGLVLHTDITLESLSTEQLCKIYIPQLSDSNRALANPFLSCPAAAMAEANNAALYESRRRQTGGSQVIDNIVSGTNCRALS